MRADNTEHLDAQLGAKAQGTEVVDYLRHRDGERRKNRRLFIILAIATAVVGGFVYNVKHSIDEEHRKSQEVVNDLSCAMYGRDC